MLDTLILKTLIKLDTKLKKMYNIQKEERMKFKFTIKQKDVVVFKNYLTIYETTKLKINEIISVDISTDGANTFTCDFGNTITNNTLINSNDIYLAIYDVVKAKVDMYLEKISNTNRIKEEDAVIFSIYESLNPVKEDALEEDIEEDIEEDEKLFEGVNFAKLYEDIFNPKPVEFAENEKTATDVKTGKNYKVVNLSDFIKKSTETGEVNWDELFNPKNWSKK